MCVGCFSDSTEKVTEASGEENCAKDVKAARKKKFKKAMKCLKIGGRVVLIISKVALSAAGVGTEIVDVVEGAVEISQTTMDMVDTASDAIGKECIIFILSYQWIIVDTHFYIVNIEYHYKGNTVYP